MRMQVRTIVLLILVALILSGCPGPQPRPTVAPHADAESAARLAEAGRTEEAAALYGRSADRSSGVEAYRLRLEAAELWMDVEEPDLARRQLTRLNLDALSPIDRVRAQFISARIALAEGRAGDAIARMPPPTRLDRAISARILSVRAQAHRSLGNYHLALQDLVEREALLRDRAEIADNQQRIWDVLRQVDTNLIETDEPLLAGWVALAEVRRLAWQDPDAFQRALSTWRRAHPDHPAGVRFVPTLVEEQRHIASGVREIGLILPLSGRFSAAAAAVRDGLLAAHYRGSNADRRPRIRIYDTQGDVELAVQRYQEAVADGVDFVIGPLQREAVAAIARLGRLPVPVLALNTLDDMHAPEGLFQFGLVPEEEAHQIAERVFQQGMEAGIALVPDNDLGIRMSQAFRQRFEELGGTVLSVELYSPQQQDHTTSIIRSLTIDESRSRQQVLRSVLNLNLQWEPRRRRDAEFVFLIGNPQQGRALRPQLRFHHASDLPVFASSHIYTGVPNRSQDSDMNGIVFTDMPWNISPDSMAAESKQQLSQYLGGALERNIRLFALGYDAYRLAPVLQHNPALLREPVPAATGALHLDSGRRIHRVLSWAEFVNGTALPLR